ncbi:hypothetical protein DY000_02040507 [Brassica cretica]|uniref:Anaphase-promoting complex subunit 1 n=1 Tax=Brassica cretica TaxID=69181 RepID=A0ABQ7BF62_BRACR|nr:hypothetical protein DY000_02040507 [Brassica cretica]
MMHMGMMQTQAARPRQGMINLIKRFLYDLNAIGYSSQQDGASCYRVASNMLGLCLANELRSRAGERTEARVEIGNALSMGF